MARGEPALVPQSNQRAQCGRPGCGQKRPADVTAARDDKGDRRHRQEGEADHQDDGPALPRRFKRAREDENHGFRDPAKRRDVPGKAQDLARHEVFQNLRSGLAVPENGSDKAALAKNGVGESRDYCEDRSRVEHGAIHDVSFLLRDVTGFRICILE